MRDADLVIEEAGVDPIVLALALALTARRPVTLFAGAGSSVSGAESPKVRAAGASVSGQPRVAHGRAVRSKNRKG